ncbi:MAG: acylphosphatase [Candidatus Methanoperedens sp.]|nr:acylphosphatase [Candidatus Methanoperedens sp.]
MKRIHAFISGEVQGVGYREEVKRVAFDLNIFGCVKNLEDGRVEIIAEGEDKNIEEFSGRIYLKRYPIFVVKIEVEEESYKGEFRAFRVIRDKDVQKEILSALSRGTVEIHEMKEILLAVRQDTAQIRQDTAHIPEIKENTRRTLKKQDSMLDKQDKMLEKQDTAIHILNKISEDTSDMKSTLSRIEIDVKDTKFSLSSFIEEKYQKLEGEIAEIKATLARMQAVG